MRNIIVALSLTIMLILGSFGTVERPDYRVKKIVLDAGHGGKDPGTSGAHSKEKDIALDVVLKLGKIINEYLPDVEVIYTRKGDTYPEVYKRAELANKEGADLFISIHANWVSNPQIRGTETYVMGLHKTQANLNVAMRENSVINLEENSKENYDGFDPNSPESYILFSLAQNAYVNNSLMLAENVEKQFGERAGRKSRGVKSAGFLVLWQTSMPSILVETGYLSNEREERELNDELVQTYIASGIYRAFRDYKSEIESMN
ncbi:MAG: N-acetylmuramoyl-L-alanine amidase [Bacteroidetes bacterium]|nr:N-acetylmuramoyl-L-alanine amidase [Bacteroidota bacterium]MDA1121428.1 N-acetylmuramoyl-L-alanine amidase [Bacteroidota bacterium]